MMTALDCNVMHYVRISLIPFRFSIRIRCSATDVTACVTAALSDIASNNTFITIA